jgi:endoglucanase
MKSVLAIGLFCVAMQALADGFLRAEGQRIVVPRGEPMTLHGMRLDGWMLHDGYMLQLGDLRQQHAVRHRIEELIGPERTAEFDTVATMGGER